MLSLELASSMLIKFDGNKAKLFEFIDNTDKAYSLVSEVNKPILFSIIETKLTDNARAITRNRSFPDWPSLKQYLLDAYSERRTMGQWQLELNSCKQNSNETVMAYSTKIENCYIKLINSLDNSLSRESREACVSLLKEQTLSVFIAGLRPDISLSVKSQRPQSLEKAIATALQEEQEIKSKTEIYKYQSIHNSSVRHCNYCNKPGHTSFNCRFNKSNQVRHIQNNYSHNSSRRSNTISENQQFSQNSNIHRANPSDFNKNAHPNNNFNNNNKFCSYCKNKGHIISECRKRQYNNDRRNNTQSGSEVRTNNLNFQAPRPQAATRNAQFLQAEFQS
ncbi:unnamed protein product [Psylliodes chrysocephalus]|uniref:CCHC-type domain-containing protein n=1 Tax=Psylliodes chrysocephalus TaxID=3402493 RepID=A0A9P0CUW3_9CUCU|nr:unnamed protein product [Psylliodes chrysocephala]